MSHWITDLTAAYRTFGERLADRQSMTIPAEDPTYGDPGRAFPLWPGPGRGAIFAAAQAAWQHCRQQSRWRILIA
jgi:hypothetical protein